MPASFGRPDALAAAVLGRRGGRWQVADQSLSSEASKRGWDSLVAGGRQESTCTVELARTTRSLSQAVEALTNGAGFGGQDGAAGDVSRGGCELVALLDPSPERGMQQTWQHEQQRISASLEILRIRA